MNGKKFSIEELADYQPGQKVRDLADSDLREFYVEGYCNCWSRKGSGKTVLFGRGINIVLPNYLKKTEVQAEIDRQVDKHNKSKESAKDSITSENNKRRFVIEFGSKY